MTSVKQSSEWITGQKLEIRDIEALAIGTWILGTGGGGNPYHSLLNMRELYKSGHRVNLIQPEELDDEALVGVLSNVLFAIMYSGMIHTEIDQMKVF